jgi:glucose-6-phosphate 1-epimerase
VLRVQNNNASASIALQGAHLFEFTPSGRDNLLFVSNAETFETGQPIRGGIPICWPWFGPHTQVPSAPAHGFVRDKIWEFEVVSDSAQRTELKLWLETNGTEFGFERKARVELLVSIGSTLVASLTTTNLDEQPIHLSQALHTYFKCDNLEDVRLHGLAGACYQDKLTGENKYIPTQFRFNQEVDWIVQEPGEPLGISGLGSNSIKMTRFGSRSLVLWNPWIEKSKTLSHFLPEDYKSMFCVETANVSEDSRLVKPKQTHVLVMELADIETH